MILCVGISHAQRIPEQSSQEMYRCCTNRDQYFVRSGPRGPPGRVNYKIVNETIKEHFSDISGQIQAKLTQIGPIVEKSSEDIEDLKAASGHTRTKLNEIDTDIEGLKSDISGQIQAKLTQIAPVVEKSSKDIEDLKAVMQQIREQLKNFILTSRGIEAPSTWYQAQNNYYYKLFDNNATYAEAKANCKILGGQLASAGIRDENVRREIVPLLKSGGNDTWIGLNDIQEENTFIWEDGVTATAGSTPWYDDQPNSYDGDQDCVEIRPKWNWTLNDEGCTDKRKYLCEIEP
uniref:low affinity immunoglobulin epsilon Fc receptor-like n=1 Tax=Styela clava TaxID=7725 RepID=UPI00193935E9|nr:low affinity immunoglobulin epsilon Fc receptor-like [Styela clava]